MSGLRKLLPLEAGRCPEDVQRPGKFHMIRSQFFFPLELMTPPSRVPCSPEGVSQVALFILIGAKLITLNGEV